MEDNFIKIQKWLYPVSFLYGIGVSVRNKLFDWGVLQSRSFDIPVISVGNITVGGTGKTPHTEYLIKLLGRNYKVAVLSRGYKRTSKGFLLAEANMTAGMIGDEPYQIRQKFPDIYMAVDKDRCHGIDQLCREEIAPGTEIILLDDAYQHRYVQPGINILLVDYYRLICNDALLPAGRLRESAKQKNRANIVIVTKCPAHIKPMDYRVISKQLNLYPYQKLFFTSFKYKELVPVFNIEGVASRSLINLGKDEHILLLTGIASPKQMIQDMEDYTSHIEPYTFGDHHNFTKTEMEELKKRFDKMKSEKKIIVTTEKDAARLIDHPHLDESLKKYIYALPVEACFLQNQEDSFNEHIMGYVNKNKRNNILSQKRAAKITINNLKQ